MYFFELNHLIFTINRLPPNQLKNMLHLLTVTFPFIGEVNLSSSLLIVFIICLLAVVGFEFVNGFHDTANAVATVIYTKALKPVYAIPWSGTWNFLGVFLG